jgi:hypothetical protein
MASILTMRLCTSKIVHFEIEKAPHPILFDRLRSVSRNRLQFKLTIPQGKTMEKLSQLVKQEPLYKLTTEDKEMIWEHRHFLAISAMPNSLIKITKSVDWFNPKQVSEMQMLATNWTQIDPLEALEMLDLEFADDVVRGCAVNAIRTMPDHQLIGYLPQLVQAVTFENYHDSPLSRLLLERALRNRPVFGHRLFWHLVVCYHHLDPLLYLTKEPGKLICVCKWVPSRPELTTHCKSVMA